jgi:hypothetical protein
MRKKPLKKSKTGPAEKGLPKTEKPSASATLATEQPFGSAAEIRTVVAQLPSPDVLLQEAEREPNFFDLDAYFSVIEVLRSKDFSYRDIAKWLSERGVDTDHNEVYRIYTRHMSDYEEAMEGQRADLEEQDEANRNR